MSFRPVWRAELRLRRPDPASTERLAATLGPEVAREVPRARTELVRAEPEMVELRIATRDTGALRAALNTYLGWVALADGTEAVANTPSHLAGPTPDPPAKRF